jgi:hypothetical protein
MWNFQRKEELRRGASGLYVERNETWETWEMRNIIRLSGEAITHARLCRRLLVLQLNWKTNRIQHWIRRSLSLHPGRSAPRSPTVTWYVRSLIFPSLEVDKGKISGRSLDGRRMMLGTRLYERRKNERMQLPGIEPCAVSSCHLASRSRALSSN